jgi:hypothetical protein
MTYCRWFQTFIDENTGILDYTWFSDGRGFTYPVMWIPKTHVCGVVKTRMHCSRNSFPRKSACSVRYHSDTTTLKQASISHFSSRLTTWAFVITAANNWAHVLQHNCKKSSVHWTYRSTFPAPPMTTSFHTGVACKYKPTFSGATFEWDAIQRVFHSSDQSCLRHAVCGLARWPPELLSASQQDCALEHVIIAWDLVRVIELHTDTWAALKLVYAILI